MVAESYDTAAATRLQCRQTELNSNVTVPAIDPQYELGAGSVLIRMSCIRKTGDRIVHRGRWTIKKKKLFAEKGHVERT